MSISGINTTQYLIGVLGALNPDPNQAEGSSAAAAVGTFMGDPTSGSSQNSSVGAQANFSQAASQLSTLATLQNQSPEQFKALAKSIAQDLSSAAKKDSDPLQKYMLTTVAGQFSNAAMSGSMASLVPGGQGNKQLRGYGGAQISLFSPSMAQGQGADVFNQISSVIDSNLSSLEA